MRIVVTGKNGQVASSLSALGTASGHEIVRLGLPEVDLSEPSTLAEPIRLARPDVIISSAAYTAVDKAESEPDLAQRVNGDGPGELAKIARGLHIPILHLSTDYVFSGDKGGAYSETDAPDPVSIYGKSKLSGEQQVAAATDNHVILRTAWVYSAYSSNFVKTMLRLAETNDEIAVVADQHGSPTYALEIARALLTAAVTMVEDYSAKLRGVFHITGQGETTWAGFAEAIFASMRARGGKAVAVKSISAEQYPTAARRPANSRLNCKKLFDAYGLTLAPWPVSLEACLEQLLRTKE